MIHGAPLAEHRLDHPQLRRLRNFMSWKSAVSQLSCLSQPRRQPHFSILNRGRCLRCKSTGLPWQAQNLSPLTENTQARVKRQGFSSVSGRGWGRAGVSNMHNGAREVPSLGLGAGLKLEQDCPLAVWYKNIRVLWGQHD